MAAAQRRSVASPIRADRLLADLGEEAEIRARALRPPIEAAAAEAGESGEGDGEEGFSAPPAHPQRLAFLESPT